MQISLDPIAPPDLRAGGHGGRVRRYNTVLFILSCIYMYVGLYSIDLEVLIPTPAIGHTNAAHPDGQVLREPRQDSLSSGFLL